MSGQEECLDVQSVKKQFEGREAVPDLVLDVGRLKEEKPSTIVKVEGDEVIVLRQGGVII